MTIERKEINRCGLTAPLVKNPNPVRCHLTRERVNRLHERKDGAKMVAGRVDTKPAEAIP